MSIKSLFHFRLDINLKHNDVFSLQIKCTDTKEKDAKHLVKILNRKKSEKFFRTASIKIEGKKLTVVTLYYCFLTTGNKALR